MGAADGEAWRRVQSSSGNITVIVGSGRAARTRGVVPNMSSNAPASAAASPADAEDEPLPLLGMDGAVEEGAAGQLFGGGLLLRGIVEHDRQRVVPGGILGRVADRGGGFGRLERNRRPIGIRRLIVGMDLGLGLAEKVLGFQLDPPAGHQFPVRRTRARGDGAVTARQAGEAEAGGILAPHQRVVPAVLAEAEQHGRIGDPRTVVGDGDGERGLARRGGDFVGPGDRSGNRNAHPRGAGAAAVLQGPLPSAVLAGNCAP